MRMTQIEVAKIKPNKENPRGIDIQTHDEKLAYLKDSIKQFGVMVPIVVSRRDGKYLLIDGERRYWASKALGLQRIPAFILDEEGAFDRDAILYRMFQIHHNREPWGPVQQCHALEALYTRIAAKPAIKSIHDERARLKAVTEELVKATGIEERTALNRVHFLRWPRPIKQRLYDNPGEEGYWYVCEIEDKIIIPSLINYPEYFEKVPVDEVRDDLFQKLEKHSVDKAVDVRRVAPFFRHKLPTETGKKKLGTVFRQLHKDKHMTFAEAQDELLKAFPSFLRRDPVSPRKLHSLMRSVNIAIEDFDISSVDTAKHRAKATRREMIGAVDALIETLKEFGDELRGGAP